MMDYYVELAMRQARQEGIAAAKALGRSIAFPNAVKFDDVFLCATPYDTSPNTDPCPDLAHWTHRPQYVHMKAETMTISSFCAVNGVCDHHCLQVMPHQSIMDWMRGNMLHLEDRITFKVVQRRGGTALVVAQHSVILGSRWLAIIDGTTVP